MAPAPSLLRDGRIFALANLVNRSAGLVLIPLYTHVLAPADYGLLAIVQSVGELAAIFAGLGFSGAMNRFFLDHPHDPAAQHRVVSTALLSVLGIGAALALLAWPLARLADQLIFGVAGHVPLFVVAFAGLLCNALLEVCGNDLIMRKRAAGYFWFSCAKALLLIGANLLLLLVWQAGVLGALLAQALGLGLLGVGASGLILHRVGLGFSPALCRQLFGFGLPLVPSALANAALPVVERYWLNAGVGPAGVGLYALASRLAALLQMFIAAPFAQTFAVRRIETLVQGQDQAGLNRILLQLVLLMSLASLALSAFGAELLALLAPPSYAAALWLLPVLGLCQVLAALNFNFELGLHFTKRTHMLPLISAVALLLSLGANALLVGPWGLAGCAAALLVVGLGRLGVTLWLNARHGSRQISLDWPRALAIMLLCSGAGWGFVALPLPALHPGAMALKLLLLLVAAALLLLSPALDQASRDALRRAWSGRRALQASHTKPP